MGIRKNEVQQVAEQEVDFEKVALGEIKVAEAKLEWLPIGRKAERCMCSSMELSQAEWKFCEWAE